MHSSSKAVRQAQSIDDFVPGVLAGDRRSVAKTITLLESVLDAHAPLAQAVVEALLPHAGGALRVGITGPPGAGKSSLIEVLSLTLIRAGKKVAVLAVDPSSPVSGGSILADKTRMELLARERNAFIRPSPSRGAMGGVSERTREAMLVCEAAGFDVVLVETVGTGQSEVAVHTMVDFFMVLLQPGAGDLLQGIKRGVLELADALVVTKADGELLPLAERTRADHTLDCGCSKVRAFAWSARVRSASGELDERRRHGASEWFHALLSEGLNRAFRSDPEIARRIEEIERDVEEQRTTPAAAAQDLLLRLRWRH